MGWRRKISADSVKKLTIDNTKAYLIVMSKRRQTKGISPQILSGLYQKVDNNLGQNANNFFELGSRLSDIRIKLNTKITYSLTRTDDKYVLTRNQKDRFLYFDFISRGVLALDSLSTSVNEYINSLQGAPLSLRLNQQINLSNPLRETISNSPQPSFFLNFAFDARLIPLAVGKEVVGAGGSFHVIPTFTATFPSGRSDEDNESDRFVIQLSGNLAYMTNNAAEVLFLGQEDVDRTSFSFEARAGLFSEDQPAKNFNFVFRYNSQPVNGTRASVGFNFAPRISTEKN